MIGNRPSTDQDWMNPDDAPDLSTPDWPAKFAAAEVKRGRPKAASPKVSTTIRLDADILAHFKAGGPGWQTRLNEALRRVVAGDQGGSP